MPTLTVRHEAKRSVVRLNEWSHLSKQHSFIIDKLQRIDCKKEKKI